jgi:hypothetical protein
MVKARSDPTNLNPAKEIITMISSAMRKLAVVLLLFAMGVFLPSAVRGQDVERKQQKQALIVVFPWFSEAPYSDTRAMLENKGVKVFVASSNVVPLPGYQKNLTVTPDILLSQVRTADYDAIVFIYSVRYEGDDPDTIRIAKEGAIEGKVLASYGWAITTLIKADVLNGKRIAAIGRSYESSAQEAGAILSTSTLEQDGKIITASLNSESQPFAEAVASALTAGAK